MIKCLVSVLTLAMVLFVTVPSEAQKAPIEPVKQDTIRRILDYLSTLSRG